MSLERALVDIEETSAADLPRVFKRFPTDLLLKHDVLGDMAVAKNALCYCSLPMARKDDNWGLVDLAIGILGKKGNNTPKVVMKVLKSMPDTMYDCFLYFLSNPPKWLKVNTQIYDRLEFFKPRCIMQGEPDVSAEQALKWVKEWHGLGYAMVPRKKRHPDLLRFLIRPSARPTWLKMVPKSVLRQESAYVKHLVMLNLLFFKYLPESMRDEEMSRAIVTSYFAGNTHLEYKRLLKLIPEGILNDNPEWVTRIIQANYSDLDYSFKLHRPDLAMRVVHAEPNAYKEIIPHSVKIGNWDLARLALSLDPALYAFVPVEMRFIELSDDERVLDLAQLASKLRRKVDTEFLTGEHYKQYLAERSGKVSAPSMGFDEMSKGTQDGLLSRLYNTGEHAHLRDLDKFREAKAVVAQAHSKIAALTGLAARRPGLFIKLSKDARVHVMSFLQHTNSLAVDHALWCKSQLLLLEEDIDRFMYSYHINGEVALIDDIMPFVADLVTHFCDPRFAWSVLASDEPRNDVVLDQRLAQTVADAVWRWFSILKAVNNIWERTNKPLNEQPEVQQELIQLGFPAPVIKVSPLAKRYLALPLRDANNNLLPGIFFSEYSKH